MLSALLVAKRESAPSVDAALRLSLAVLRERFLAQLRSKRSPVMDLLPYLKLTRRCHTLGLHFNRRPVGELPAPPVCGVLQPERDLLPGK